MNQLLVENLAERITSRVQNRENGTYDTRKFNLEFARLIVEICADIVEDGVDHREPASTYSSKIREHFGMEVENESE